jgi:hypothetical protein
MRKSVIAGLALWGGVHGIRGKGPRIRKQSVVHYGTQRGPWSNETIVELWDPLVMQQRPRIGSAGRWAPIGPMAVPRDPIDLGGPCARWAPRGFGGDGQIVSRRWHPWARRHRPTCASIGPRGARGVGVS